MFPQRLNIIDLNNAAVRQIEDGDFRSATEILTGALRLMMIQHSKEKGLGSKTTRFIWSKNNLGSLKQLKNDDDDKIGTFIFARGMFVHGTVTRGGALGEIKAVITYNAALAAHLLAVETCNSTLLAKAHALYRLTRACLKKQRERGDKSRLCNQHFFHMAILNNLGQLSYELVDYECSKTCFDQLHRNLMHLLKYEKPVYAQSDLNGMIANSIVSMPTTAPCA